MSIFGQLDAENIPDNPFWVEAGTYMGEVTDAAFKTKNDGTKYLYIEYTIGNSDSEFLDQKVAHRFDLLDPDMTAEKLEMLPPDEKRKIRMRMSAMKKVLCGDGRNKGLNVPVNDLNDADWDPRVLVGLNVDFGVKNYGSGNSGVQVSWVNIAD